MQGSILKFYVAEGDRHEARLTWEWLLDQANTLGMRGGSAFKAMAGFGRHHTLHESRFIELAGTLAIQVEFIATEEEAQKLLALVEREKLRLFYVRSPAEFGVLNPAVESGSQP